MEKEQACETVEGGISEASVNSCGFQISFCLISKARDFQKEFIDMVHSTKCIHIFHFYAAN